MVSTFASKENRRKGVLAANQQAAMAAAADPTPSRRASPYAATAASSSKGACPTFARRSPPQTIIKKVNQRSPTAGKYGAALSPNGAATRNRRPAFHHRAAK